MHGVGGGLFVVNIEEPTYARFGEAYKKGMDREWKEGGE